MDICKITKCTKFNRKFDVMNIKGTNRKIGIEETIKLFYNYNVAFDLQDSKLPYYLFSPLPIC